jgi:3-deoxy-manno-octulosonate cytidylyltransferase (CMP-KDO synthetase)
MKILLVIPARFQSSRLPGKPLIDFLGKSMIQRTYEKCAKVFDSKFIFVATDDEQIYKHCENLNIQVVMTSSDCLTGTDRVAEFALLNEADYYINVQGDEPLINPADILKVLENIKKYNGEIINGYAPIDNEKHYNSISIPKVVFRPDGRLLYMSRSPIPGNKNNLFVKSWRQICIYAFPKEALIRYSRVKDKTLLESIEDIEILRFMELGFDVRMIQLSTDSIAVDTADDVEEVMKIIKNNELK